MSLAVYGIPNCNTVKKARTWLDERGVGFVFHDHKKQGVPVARLDDWISQVGWEVLVNRQGTTWRQLDEVVKAGVLSGVSGLLFRRNSVTGALEVVPRTGSWGGLNAALHAND